MKKIFPGWALLLMMLFFPACKPSPLQAKPAVHHLILVWFDGARPEEIATIQEQTLQLEKIETVLSVSVGKAIASERSIVDDSFDLGIVMTFASVETMNQYLSDPRHKSFLKKYIKGKIKKIVVYDF